MNVGNFDFLREKKEYALFADAAIEAEKVYTSSPAMCAVGCRKALELAVKWVYAADQGITMPYRDNLQSLIHEPSFRFEVDPLTWKKLPLIIKLGNLGVHTETRITASEALVSLRGLFEFIDWIGCCYDRAYVVRHFDEKKIPQEKVIIDIKKVKEQESLLVQKDAEIESLQKRIEAMSAQYTAERKENKTSRTFTAENLSEAGTRKVYIDTDLKTIGWIFEGPGKNVSEEYPVENMAGKKGQQGFADYVLFGKDGLPLAVIEAKKTERDPNVGRRQAVLYADALAKMFGRRPMMFTTNGFETYFWDDKSGPQRQVSGVFSEDDLTKLMNRRSDKLDLTEIRIDDAITDRYYQKEAIRAVCDRIREGHRKHLLVMATGTGKTRTAASLSDVLSRGRYVTNILFLADRTALVKQARDDFKNYLPAMSLCNLCTNKEDKNARIVFSTYPTIMNAIDQAKTAAGTPLFTPAHFDLIIVDESHRSIFKKYKAIFDYFDAIIVGLTATPKTSPDADTYRFFEMEPGVPTYAYDYDTAVTEDHVLVPYYNYEVTTKFSDQGIHYDELSDKDKERFEDDFIEDGHVPDFVPSSDLNHFVFNAKTVDQVLQDVMERGIHIDGGERLGKTIIFAQNKKHAEFILQRFNALYPAYHGTFAQRVVCDDAYAQTIIDDFKKPEGEPFIAVSVDMLDTGIDVPQVVNLVFFKKVRSKIKFWQMIGRGTRLCPSLSCVDQIDGEYIGKRRFLIFDYCGNFDFFRENINGYEGKMAKSLTETIFCRKIQIASRLQNGIYAKEPYASWRQELIESCRNAVAALSMDLISVRLQRQYVERYKKAESYIDLNETAKGELEEHIAPLIPADDSDEFAKRFDSFMYGMILAKIDDTSAFQPALVQLKSTAAALEKKSSIPQVREKLSKIREIQTEEFWKADHVQQAESVRLELRDLIKFLSDVPRKIIITNLTDPVVGERVGEFVAPEEKYENYKAKVNRYINEHGNTLAIHKLTHNIPLAKGDYEELQRVLTEELGSKEDYQNAYQDTPFGLLVRKIAKLDHSAAMQAFSDFINDQSLNQNQIAFVHKIISHIEQNGYMENASDLLKPPFDRPISFMKLFNKEKQAELIRTIGSIKKNALDDKRA